MDFTGMQPHESVFTLPLVSLPEVENASVRLENYGDLDQDGTTDLFVVQDVGDSNQFVHVFLGPHQGELSLDEADLIIDTSRDGTREPLDVVRTTIGDLNEDGHNDLVLVVPATEGDEIWIFDHHTLF